MMMKMRLRKTLVEEIRHLLHSSCYQSHMIQQIKEKDQETASTRDLIQEDNWEHMVMGLLQFWNYLNVDQYLSQEKVDQPWEMENRQALFHELSYNEAYHVIVGTYDSWARELEMKKQLVMGKVMATKVHLEKELELEQEEGLVGQRHQYGLERKINVLASLYQKQSDQGQDQLQEQIP